MRLRWVLGYLIVWTMLVALLSGCSKKEDAPPAPEQTRTTRAAPLPTAQDGAPEAVGQPVSPLIAEFLERKVRMRKIAADDPIAGFFTSWENVLQQRSRQPLDLHFDVQVEGAFSRDHAWESSTNRGMLDELCQACNFVWTVASPNTIRITRKTG